MSTDVAAILDANRYMVLGTTEDAGGPRVSPVYFTHDACRTFFWVSSPDAQHSRNIAARPEVAIVVFDSSREPSRTEAVYVAATAEEVPQAELDAACAVAFARVGGGARAFAPEELIGAAPVRLYRAVATEHEVHVRGSDPDHGRGVDTRLRVGI